jgi:hypothetical protein
MQSLKKELALVVVVLLAFVFGVENALAACPEGMWYCPASGPIFSLSVYKRDNGPSYVCRLAVPTCEIYENFILDTYWGDRVWTATESDSGGYYCGHSIGTWSCSGDVLTFLDFKCTQIKPATTSESVCPFCVPATTSGSETSGSAPPCLISLPDK